MHGWIARYLINVAGVLLLLAGSMSSAAETEKTRILYFSSFPEIMQKPGEPGLAELASAIRQETDRNPDTFFVSGGAFFGPSVFGAMDNGAHMVDILNAINPSVMAVGKREFSYGFDNFILNALSATFPLVTSNLVDAASGGEIEATYATFMIENRSMPIGVVALTSANSVSEYGAVQARLINADTAARKAAASLRDEGAVAIILLADTDYDDLSTLRADGTADIIFYTHNFGNPLTLDSQGALLREGALDGKIIAVDIWQTSTPGGETSLQTEAALLDLSDYQPAPDVAAIVNDYRARLDLLLGRSIATVTQEFNTFRAIIRSRENAFANLVTDALRTQVGADITLLNSGSIRGNTSYPNGHQINRGDIQRELPFGNKTALLRLKGSAILDALEHGIDCGLNEDGCFTHFSNLAVRYNSQLPKGERITSVLVGGTTLDPEAYYRTAVTDFMADGNDGYEMLAGGERLHSVGTNRLLWNVVVEHVERMSILNLSIDGRLVDDTQPEQLSSGETRE